MIGGIALRLNSRRKRLDSVAAVARANSGNPG
jgi:hypothetical protein